MPRMPRPLLPTLLIGLMPLGAVADELCAAQSQALIQRIAADVTPAPSDDQLAQMRAISEELCAAHTAQTGMPVPPPEGYADWFTYFMLHKQPEKEGNKRLKRLK